MPYNKELFVITLCIPGNRDLIIATCPSDTRFVDAIQAYKVYIAANP